MTEALFQLLSLPELLPVVAAWLVLLGGAAPVARLIRRAPREAGLFAAIVLVALALRLAVPWGPINFVEGERNSALWSNEFWTGGLRGLEKFASEAIMLGMLRLIGVPPLFVVRAIYPLIGALGVGAVYLLARAAQLGRWSAVIAAGVLLAWPAHVRYSASTEFTPFTALIWTLAFAVALSRSLGRMERIVLLAALVVLGVYARPESRLMCVALIPVLLTREWTWTERFQLGALLLLGLLPYVRGIGLEANEPQASPGERRELLIHQVRLLLTQVSLSPVWWSFAAAAGLFFGRTSIALRASCVLAIGLLLVAFSFFGTEHNPLFGLWRYDLLMLPWIALLAAGMVPNLTPRPASRDGKVRLFFRYAMPMLLLILPLGAYQEIYRRTIDMQAQFQYLLRTAPKIAALHHPIAVATEDSNEPGEIALTRMQLFAFGLSGLPVQLAECQPNLLAVFRQDEVLQSPACAAGPIDLFLGLHRRSTGSDRVDEETIPAAPASPAHNTQCQHPKGEGVFLEDCPITLGWYNIGIPR